MSLTLTVTDGPHKGKAFHFNRRDVFLVGRSPQAHFLLGPEDPHFSRIHFLVEVNPPHCRVIDLGSRNGTFINGERILGSTELKDGDSLRAGRTVLGITLNDDPDQTCDAGPPPTSEPLKEDMPPPSPRAVGVAEKPTVCGGCGEPPGQEAPWLCPTCEAESDLLEQPVPGYRLIRELGQGGMGVVYQAVLHETGLVVAMKVIRPAVSGTPSMVNRFMREAKILQKLTHPHIVKFHEMGEAEGRLYFAMDFIKGTDAQRLALERGGKLPVKTAVRLILQVARALEYAHGEGFVHRDIKPENILLGKHAGKTSAILADFGLAGIYQGSALSGLSISHSGGTAGTPRYMSPEQLSDFHGVGPASDQFSTAATLYRLLSGNYTYEFPSSPEWMLMLLQDDPVPILERAPELPEGLAAAIHLALAREPADRFPDMTAFRRALTPFGK